MDPAILALAQAVRACTPPSPAIAPRDPDPTPPPLQLVLRDLDALLARVYATTTKLALALKPAAPSHSASIPLLHDLAQHSSALTHCTRLLHDTIHGATLVKDARNRVKDIIDALRALIQTFLDNAAHGASGEDYLVRTGTLHDLIANARCPSGIQKENRAAVYLSWKSDRESLEDNLQEVTRMIDQAESNDPDSESDDGWDELELGRATKLDKDELARAKNVHQVLRLTTLLHKRIFLDLLAYPSSAPVSAFDSLLVQSNRLLSTSDDLVAALYTPQDPAHVRTEILQLVEIATCLKTQIPVFLPLIDELASQLHALNVDDHSPVATSASPSKKKADKKWFDTCVDQIVRSCSRANESSTRADKPISPTQHTVLPSTE